MVSLNKVFLIGNLTKDLDMHYTSNGMPVTNLKLAVNRRFKNSRGELNDDTCLLTASAWDKQAEICRHHLRKGSAVFIEGILESRQWRKDDGATRSCIDIRIERIQFLHNNVLKIEKVIEGIISNMPGDLSQ
jgi:single-strand DNA-binding protein